MLIWAVRTARRYSSPVLNSTEVELQTIDVKKNVLRFLFTARFIYFDIFYDVFIFIFGKWHTHIIKQIKMTFHMLECTISDNARVLQFARTSMCVQVLQYYRGTRIISISPVSNMPSLPDVYAIRASLVHLR